MRATKGRYLLFSAVAAATIAVGACGGDDEPTTTTTTSPDPAVDEAAITEVLIENEIGGPERCTEIYTEHYLAINYNEDVIAIEGDTPLEKCENDAPLAGITADDLDIEVLSLDGEAGEATASAELREQFPVAFSLIRDGESWRIDGFAD